MRALQPLIEADLKQKMVFIGGPRQSGKTTLARQILMPYGSAGLYLNWDDPLHRQQILARRWRAATRLLVFDELHKYPRWKNWLKGVYDTRPNGQTFLITGSARLDVYRRGGDSMLGRYHYWHLHPFCLGELPTELTPQQALPRLLRLGGFPEPFLSNDEKVARRWQRARHEIILREDIRELTQLHDLVTLEVLLRLLQQRVGSLVVVANLMQDLQVAHKTVQHWLEVLQCMYLIFAVKPYHVRQTRMLSKPTKFYFFDNTDVKGDIGARFENLVATHLLKWLQFLQDSTGYAYELRYIRDREGREVDFVILKEGQVDTLIEVKWAASTPSTSLRYFAQRLAPRRALQIVGKLPEGFDMHNIEVRAPHEILTNLQSAF